MVLVWFFCYGWSVGPLPYVISAEVGSAQLRSKTIAVARGSYVITQIANTVAAPYVLNPTAGNLKGKGAFIPFSFMAVLLVWSYFRLPETKGRSFEELDILFGECDVDKSKRLTYCIVQLVKFRRDNSRIMYWKRGMWI
jgi:SP family general alpha glucoside:H+ symporter-like MFS transporter